MRTGRAATAVLVAIALAGCGGSGDSDPVASASGGPRALPTAASQTVPVDLTFAGAVSGHVTSAKTGPKFECGTPTFPDVFILSDLEVELDAKVWALSVVANGYTGPGRITADIAVTLADPNDPTGGFVGTDRDTTEMTINDDTRSGTTKDTLFRSTSGDTVTVQVSGTWRCP